MKLFKSICMVLFLVSLPTAVSADWLSAQMGTVPVSLSGFSFTGKPATGAITMLTVPHGRTYSFPANLTASGNAVTSNCTFITGATADAAFLLKDCDTSGSCTTKATLTVLAGTKVCSLSTQAAFTIAQDHLIEIVAPTQDSTLADGSFTLGATRQ